MTLTDRHLLLVSSTYFCCSTINHRPSNMVICIGKTTEIDGTRKNRSGMLFKVLGFLYLFIAGIVKYAEELQRQLDATEQL